MRIPVLEVLSGTYVFWGDRRVVIRPEGPYYHASTPAPDTKLEKNRYYHLFISLELGPWAAYRALIDSIGYN